MRICHQGLGKHNQAQDTCPSRPPPHLALYLLHHLAREFATAARFEREDRSRANGRDGTALFEHGANAHALVHVGQGGALPLGERRGRWAAFHFIPFHGRTWPDIPGHVLLCPAGLIRTLTAGHLWVKRRLAFTHCPAVRADPENPDISG